MKNLVLLVAASAVFVFGVNAESNVKALSTDKPSVAKWDNDATGAFTLMFDDGGISSIDVAMPELKQRRLSATFYIVPASGNYKARNKENDPKWVNAFADNPEFVPGNHLMQHGGSGTYDGVTNEFKECTDYILTNVPGKNPRLISYGRPGVENWPLTEEEELAVCKSLNLVSRPTFDGHGARIHLSDRAAMSALANKAAVDGSYEYVVFHGLENTNRAPDNASQDYLWVAYAEYAPFFDDICALRNANGLWVADHISVHKYEAERNAAVVTSLETTDGSIAFNVTCPGLDANLYDQPLCVKVPVPGEWQSASYRQGAGDVATTAPVDGIVKIHVLPGSGAVSVWSSVAETPEVVEVSDEPEVVGEEVETEPEADIVVPGGQGEVPCEDPALTDDKVLFVGEGTTAVVSKVTGECMLTKRGPGAVRFAYNSDFGNMERKTGALLIEEGTVEFDGRNNNYELGNEIVVGGAGKPAVLKWLGQSSSVTTLDNASIVVKDGGTLDLTGRDVSVQIQTVKYLRVEKGGLLDAGKTTIMFCSTAAASDDSVWIEGLVRSQAEGQFRMKSGGFTVPETLESPLVWNGSLRVVQVGFDGMGWINARLNVADAPDFPVEMVIGNGISNNGSTLAGIDKIGPGVARLTGASTYGGDISHLAGRTRVLEGTLLADNKTGSATGVSRIEVGAGSTLGGTGTIGGLTDLAGAANATLNLDGDASGYATVRPGSIDSMTGAHVFGTLTAGSSAQSCPTAFGNRSQLKIGVGDRGKVDGLVVNGSVTISDEDTSLSVVADGIDLSEAKSGHYAILSATEGIEGDFASVTTPKPSWKVSKVMNGNVCSALELVIPPSGLTVIVR